MRGTTCPCDPGSLPRRGGRACAPVRNGGGMGGGMEGPPVRGPAGPRFPLLPAATPPRQGRGLRPVRRWNKGVEGAGTMYGLFPGARPCVPCAEGRAARPAGGSYGMVWYGMVCCCCCCCCCEGTQHVPVGEIARHALPGQGAREQSAGVTLACA